MEVKAYTADCLYQIQYRPVRDGDLISKQARDQFVKIGLVKQCEGYNIITKLGRDIIYSLRIKPTTKEFIRQKLDSPESDLEAEIIDPIHSLLIHNGNF